MDNVSLGSYIPGNTIGHKLDPRVKLFYNIIFITMIFMTQNFLKMSLVFIPIFFLFIVSIREPKKLFTILLTVLFIGFFLFWINAFLASDELEHSTVAIKNNYWIFQFWYAKTKTVAFNNQEIQQLTYHFKISLNVIRMTLLIMFRIYMMIVATTILITTTKPSALTKAIEDMLWPLKLIKIPVQIISRIISLALRFIPTILFETQRIMKAQASRGVDFKNGSIKSKAKSMITLIIPLFISSFSKAEDLSNAMEVRGYDPYGKRTKYREYKLIKLDFFFIAIILSSFLFILISMPSITGSAMNSINNLFFEYK